MSSTTARPSHPDKRANGVATPDTARPRVSAHDSFRGDFSDPRHREASPQSSYAGTTSHKRTASGNPRPASRATEERRTEHVKVTTRETLVTRIRSPERRNGPAPKEKVRPGDGGAKAPRPTETRANESKAEPPPGTPRPCSRRDTNPRS